MKFSFQLIGSGKKHLVTEIEKGNKGYDFDYNLIIPHPENGRHHKAKMIKKNFMSAFKTALRGTNYTSPEDSTSAITIKVLDKNHKRILYSCDFSIIYYGERGTDRGYYYLRNDKERGKYEFVFRPLNSNVEEKVNEICEYSSGWNYIREEYLKLKNINKKAEKRSFSIYIEAVNNVFNQIVLH